MKVREVLNWSARELEKAEIFNSWEEAQNLLKDVLGLSQIDLWAKDLNPKIEWEKMRTLKSLLSLRQRGIPLPFLTQKAYFRFLKLKVKPGVFIPRSETEILVDVVISLLSSKLEPKILDLGTGSGAIALSLASEIKGAFVYATDVSQDALRVAFSNASRLGLSDKVCLIESDLFENLADLKGKLDCIVSNPPYIPSWQIDFLPREVKEFEPLSSLDGGYDGLTFYRKIIKQAPDFLKSGGLIAFEVGLGQAPLVINLLSEKIFKKKKIFKDYSGRERIVTTFLR